MTRYVKGEKHPNAKLTDDQIRAIRALAHDGVGTHALAREFGITATHVKAIVNRTARRSA
ncbi:MAG: hypothetical protein ABWY63_14295 [Hyphomicrobiaceae bacterium]